MQRNAMIIGLIYLETSLKGEIPLAQVKKAFSFILPLESLKTWKIFTELTLGGNYYTRLNLVTFVSEGKCSGHVFHLSSKAIVFFTTSNNFVIVLS